MAFETGLYFAVAYNDGGTRRLVCRQTKRAEVLLYPADPTALGLCTVNAIRFYDGAGTQVAIPGIPTALFRVERDSTGAAGDHTTVELSLSTLAGMPVARQNSIIDTFLAGGSAQIDVQLNVQETLTVRIRALKTFSYLLNANVAEKAHYGAVSGDNFAVPGSDALANYSYEVAEGYDAALNPTGSYTKTVTAGASGDLTFPNAAADAAPPDASTQSLLLKITDATTGKSSILPCNVYVPTDLIVLLDRSGSMGASVTASLTKWSAAAEVSDLFSDLYGNLVPSVSTPNSSIATQNKARIGRFYWNGSAALDWTPGGGFANASATPHVPADAPSGGTPIGQSLKTAASQFTASKWRRRHVILLTDGMDNEGTPSLTSLSATDFPPLSDTSAGVFLHVISYALSGETPVTSLSGLASAHGGRFYDAAPDTDPLASDNLRSMFLSVIGDLLPVDRSAAGTGSTATVSVPVEEGIERAFFALTRDSITLAVSTTGTGGGTTSTSNPGSANGIAFASAENPEPGNWSASGIPSGARLHALYDLALRMRYGAEPRGVGRPIRVWVELSMWGEPVTGADVRVGTRQPIESLGEVLTTFVQKGGLIKAVRRGQLSLDALMGAQQTRFADRTAAAAAAVVDTRSIQRQLLDAAEAGRNLGFQYAGSSVTLEEVSPGRYEATIAQTDNENSYNLFFRADGFTAEGSAFARDARLSVVLAPTPSPEHSIASFVKGPVVDKRVTWTVTVFPRTATNKPVGPGLAGSFLVFDYADPKDRTSLPPLAIVDHFDGTYSTTLTIKESEQPPAVGLFGGRPAPGHPGHGVVVKPGAGKARRVRVKLDKILVLDDKDGIFTGRGEVAFASVVAPNGNPHRSVRTRFPTKGTVKVTSGQVLDLNAIIYEGLVEPGASLSVTIGGAEFDYLLFFTRKEQFARYHRTVPLRSAKYAPGDEPKDPESLRDWRVWYTVEVE